MPSPSWAPPVSCLLETGSKTWWRFWPFSDMFFSKLENVQNPLYRSLQPTNCLRSCRLQVGFCVSWLPTFFPALFVSGFVKEVHSGDHGSWFTCLANCHDACGVCDLALPLGSLRFILKGEAGEVKVNNACLEKIAARPKLTLLVDRLIIRFSLRLYHQLARAPLEEQMQRLLRLQTKHNLYKPSTFWHPGSIFCPTSMLQLERSNQFNAIMKQQK